MELKNTQTGETAPAHRIGTTEEGAVIYQHVEGWEPTFEFSYNDEDGNYVVEAE